MEYSLTVIVCSYNRQKILENCIKSLVKIKDTILPIEIVLIDDGSKKLLSESFKNFLIQNKVNLFRNKKNMGLAYSRNKGIKESKSKYVLICDDDDIYENPLHLRSLYESVVKEKVDMGLGIPKAQSSFNKKQISTLKNLFLKGITPPVSYQIYKKEILKNNYDEKIKAGIDMDLWINLLSKNPLVLLMANCDIRSFKHKENNSLTKNYRKRKLNLEKSMYIWENKINQSLGSRFLSRFKKASNEYELWFIFLSKISDFKFLESFKIFFKSNLLITIYRCFRYMLWKFLKIKMPINSYFIKYF